MTHVPSWLIKGQWNKIGKTLLCWKQCPIPKDVRKIIIYYAVIDALIDAMIKRTQAFCDLRREYHHSLRSKNAAINYSVHRALKNLPTFEATWNNTNPNGLNKLSRLQN
jgi:hypothetical protein